MKRKDAIPKLFENDPIREAAAKVAVTEEKQSQNRSMEPVEVSPDSILSLSQFSKDKLSDVESIQKLFPDIELSMQIVGSSILSPNDMETTNLIYSSENNAIPSDTRRAVLNMIKEHISNKHGLEDKLQDIVREAMFTKGAYVEAVIPENVVTNIINDNPYNVSLEALTTRLAKNIDKVGKQDFLGDLSRYNISFESGEEVELTNRDIDESYLHLNITDNPLLALTDVIAAKGIEEKIKLGLEEKQETSQKVKTNKKDFSKLFKEVSRNKERVIDVERYMGGENIYGVPYTPKIPVTAAIPVHAVGNPNKHLGYFFVYDEKGSPINMLNEIKIEDDKPLYMQQANSTIVERANTALRKSSKKAPQIENLEEIYGELVNSMLRSKLKSGKLGDAVDISSNISDIYDVMLKRTLRNKKTNILFLPANMVSYYTFKYRDNGTGESFLEGLTTLASIRAILLITRIKASIDNSITTTNVEVKMDENDQDVAKAMNKVMSTVLHTREAKLPIGINKMEELTDWVRRAGIRFKFIHPSLPDMEVNTTEENTNKVLPDTDLENEIRKFMIMSFSLPPKVVEDGWDSDFATTVVQNNIMFAKRMNEYRKKLESMLTNHGRIYMTHDELLRTKIKDIIKSDIKKILSGFDNIMLDHIKANNYSNDDLADLIIDNFIDTIEIGFARAEKTNTEGLLEAFEKYGDAVDRFVDKYWSIDSLPDSFKSALGDTDIDQLQMAIKSVLVRKWMADNDFMPELTKMVTVDNEGNPLYDLLGDYNDYIDTISDLVLKFQKENRKIKNRYDKKFTKLEEEPVEEEVPTETTPPKGGATEQPTDNPDDGTVDTTTDVTPPDDTAGDDLEQEFQALD